MRNIVVAEIAISLNSPFIPRRNTHPQKQTDVMVWELSDRDGIDKAAESEVTRKWTQNPVPGLNVRSAFSWLQVCFS